MLKVGQFLGDRYEILAQIGVGGMAEVYRAKCHKLNRMVAIKVLKDEFNEKNFVGKFKAEAQAAAGLSHPNIVSIYDVGDEENLHYIVMELVEGITLKQYIEKKKKLDIKEAIGITIQVAQGIGAAHEQHIIHRDIKPQNIIISRDGKVKVTDFGIAKVASSHTIDSKAVGSVYYFSPEQARGGYCDERSDIYSLGITLYEMLTGQVPFVGESTVAVALAHLQMDMVPPRQIDPLIPVSLEKIIMRATQKKPERRYSSASELIADLRKALLMPDEDFVKVMPTENTSPTLLIGEDEITAIKQNKTVTIIDEDPHPNVVATYTSDSIGSKSKIIDVPEKKKVVNDDEDEEKVRSVWDKIVFGFGIIICIMILCIAGYLLSTTLKTFSSKDETTALMTTTVSETTLSTKEVRMPYVVGMSFEDAVKLLKENSLGVTRLEQSSEKVAEGLIISQEFPENTILDKNSSVELIVSSGSQLIVLPDEDEIIGVSLKNVRRNLKALGLNVKEEPEYSDTVKVDMVIKTYPEPGSRVEPGSEITVYVSLGQEIQYVYVPELRGYTEEEAADMLGTDLIIGETTEKYSDGTNYTKGQIMEQSLKVNEKVEKGTKVDLVISKGSEYIAIPDIKGKTEEEALKMMEEAGLEFDKASTIYDETVEEELVCGALFSDKDLKDGKIRIGAKYELVLSKGSENTKVPSLIGLTQKEAEELLEKADLKFGDVIHDYDASDVGLIFKQSVEAGEVVKKGSEIGISISMGKNTVKIDLSGVIGKEYSVAAKALKKQGFVVERKDVESSTVTEGCVMRCNVEEGTVLDYGSTVIVEVALAPVPESTEAPTKAPQIDETEEEPEEEETTKGKKKNNN